MPRIWEKLKAGLEAMQAGLPEEQRHRFRLPSRQPCSACGSSSGASRYPRSLSRPSPGRRRDVLNLRVMLGLDQYVAVNVGAAPTPVEVLEFFHAIGIELAELWGMSETCGFGTCNRPGQVKLGTVGPASPGVEMTIADDGELLVRGEFLMLGYRNQPDKTAEAIDADGWLHTGDIGQIDEDGFLKIVDRKKEIIINAAGKNMSPANIEAALKTGSPIIGQACCIGDARPYNTALIVLDADYAPQWAAQNGLEGKDLAELAKVPAGDRGGAGRRRCGQPAPRAGRGDQEVHDRRGRLVARRRRADADDEAQAAADLGQVRGRDRRDVRGLTGWQAAGTARGYGFGPAAWAHHTFCMTRQIGRGRPDFPVDTCLTCTRRNKVASGRRDLLRRSNGSMRPMGKPVGDPADHPNGGHATEPMPLATGRRPAVSDGHAAGCPRRTTGASARAERNHAAEGRAVDLVGVAARPRTRVNDSHARPPPGGRGAC